jgi:hypothetical protein
MVTSTLTRAVVKTAIFRLMPLDITKERAALFEDCDLGLT